MRTLLVSLVVGGLVIGIGVIVFLNLSTVTESPTVIEPTVIETPILNETPIVEEVPVEDLDVTVPKSDDPSVTRVSGEVRIKIDENTTLRMIDTGEEIKIGSTGKYKDIYYGGLHISTGGYSPKANIYQDISSKPFSGVAYVCNGALVEDTLDEPLETFPYQWCETNGTDSLTQYEMSHLLENPNNSGFHYGWFKLYLKKIKGIDFVIRGSLEGDTVSAEEAAQEGGLMEIETKQRWLEMMKNPTNQKNILAWDRLINSMTAHSDVPLNTAFPPKDDPSVTRADGEVRIRLDDGTTIKMKDTGEGITVRRIGPYKTFYYAGLKFSKDVYSPFPDSYKPFIGISYACNGPLMEDYLSLNPYQQCNTNGKDFLSQFEVSSLFEEPENPNYQFAWHKLYIKKINGVDLIIKADLEQEALDSRHGAYSEVPLSLFSRKGNWEEMMKNPVNQDSIKKWDEIVDSITGA